MNDLLDAMEFRANNAGDEDVLALIAVARAAKAWDDVVKTVEAGNVTIEGMAAMTATFVALRASIQGIGSAGNE